MLKNYILVMLRNLRKNGTYSFINIAGLSIGITCSLLILLWVFDELSFDRFHPKADRLYQVYVNAFFDGKVNTWRSIPLPTSEGLKTEHSSIVNTTSTDWGGERLLAVGENSIRKRGYYAGEEFLEMFQFPLVQGDPAKVLDDQTSIVISESTAKALFGDEDPINKIVRVDNLYDQKVSGVVKDVPKNSSFEFDCLLPWKLYETLDWMKNNKDNWGNYSWQAYVELSSGESEADVEKKIQDLLVRHGEKDMKPELFLHPLKMWRLQSDFENGVVAGGGIEYVKLFTVIAAFILIIACINFMNLATARSERRAKEVGIRKSVGSGKRELVMQFIGESLFISFLACIIAVLLTELLLPFYNDLVEKKLFIDYSALPFWLFVVVLVLFTGIVSGSYPAFYLSSFQPVKVLKGKVQVGKNAGMPRKVLVTLQFGFSILLIIGTLVIYRQIQYIKSRDLGYDRENLITIWHNQDIRKVYRSLKTELLQTGVVNAVTKSNSPITDIWSNNFLGWPGKPEDQRVIFSTVATEYDYIKTMGIKLLMGRDFSEEYKSDTAAIIVNKAALDLMGLQEPIIGTQLDLWDKKRELIGVVENTLMGSPTEPIKPLFMVLDPEWVSAVTIRLEKTADLTGSLRKVEAVFKKYTPAYPFEYKFVDDEFEKKFTDITMTAQLANLFASLAIVITGLGLFGLASFTAEQRTKEIGIRKVLGASVSSVVSLMSMDFSKLVIISFGISAPVAWWALNEYLERYTVRVGIPWWVFLVTGLIALIFALLIVSTQAWRAARANPVRSLRSE